MAEQLDFNLRMKLTQMELTPQEHKQRTDWFQKVSGYAKAK